MAPSSVQYPIADIPRDQDAASKIDIPALRAWWKSQDEDAVDLYALMKDVKHSWPSSLPAGSWWIVLVRGTNHSITRVTVR